MSTDDTVQCWICLDSAAPLCRNPPPCKCKDGGWIHADCLDTLIHARDTPRKFRYNPDKRRVTVYVPHGPCKAEMRVGAYAVGHHVDFVQSVVMYLLVTLSMQGASVALPLIGTIGIVGLMLLLQAPLLCTGVTMLVVGVPLSVVEMRHRYIIQATAVFLFVVFPALSTLAIVCTGVVMRTLFHLHAYPWAIAQMPRRRASE